MKQYAGIHPSSVKVLPQKHIFEDCFFVLQPTQKSPLENVAKRHISEAVSLMFPCLALGRFRLEEVWASGLFAGESYGGQNQSSKVFRTWKYEKSSNSSGKRAPKFEFQWHYFANMQNICHSTTPIDVLLSWQLPWTTHCASRQVVHNRCPR